MVKRFPSSQIRPVPSSPILQTIIRLFGSKIEPKKTKFPLCIKGYPAPLLDSSRKNPQLSAMRNRWTEQGFQEALDRWAADYGEELAARLYTARLIGAESDLVLHGGGNVSVKSTIRNIFQDEVEVVHVKASGGDMSRIEPRNLPPLRQRPLRRLRGLAELDDLVAFH